MLRPPALNPLDEIRILTTARKVDEQEIADAIQWVESLGYTARLGKTIGKISNQYGGNDEERREDFQAALDDPQVKAIWFGRGGYGSIRILDRMNWDRFIAHPKWLIGFSDITIWHNHINQFFGIQTLHALMPITFATNTTISRELLSENMQGNYPPISFSRSNYNVHESTVTGEIIGGNLSILYSLLGTKSGFNTNGKILFIEEIDEYRYHIDRMMISLRHAGKLDGLKALVVGGFTDIKDNEIPFGKSYQEIILDHTRNFGYPIIFDFPCGHIADNRPLILNAQVKFSFDNDVTMQYSSDSV